MQMSNIHQLSVLPGVAPEMLRPTFWTARFRDLDLDEDWIRNFEFPAELNLGNYFTDIDNCLERLFNEDGAPLEPGNDATRVEYWERPEYGLIIEPGALKLLPRVEPLFSNHGESDLDRNQLSGLDPGDPVILFGKSRDGDWLLVISDAGTGWVKRDQVGIGSRKEIEDYYKDPDRLVAIDSSPKLLTNDGLSEASMGCSFPLNDQLHQTVIIPCKNSRGNLTFKTGVVIGGTVRGHLPKTARHLVQQAFKYLGWHYAWGDRDAEGNGRDCSRLVRDVLRSLGFRPPRNSREQLAGGKKRINMTGMNIPQRVARLKKASPGSLLFTSSHVMFLLGEYRGEVYAIHALNNYRRIVDNKEEPVKIKQVVVSGLSLGSGTDAGSLMEQITEVIEF